MVNLTEEFDQRASVMKTVPHFLKGPLWIAMRLALQEIGEGSRGLEPMREERGWKLFLLHPCKEYISHTENSMQYGYDENDNNNMSNETKCETNYSINNKWNNMRNKHLTKHDTNDGVDLDNCVVHTVR